MSQSHLVILFWMTSSPASQLTDYTAFPSTRSDWSNANTHYALRTNHFLYPYLNTYKAARARITGGQAYLCTSKRPPRKRVIKQEKVTLIKNNFIARKCLRTWLMIAKQEGSRKHCVFILIGTALRDINSALSKWWKAHGIAFTNLQSRSYQASTTQDSLDKASTPRPPRPHHPELLYPRPSKPCQANLLQSTASPSIG